LGLVGDEQPVFYDYHQFLSKHFVFQQLLDGLVVGAGAAPDECDSAACELVPALQPPFTLHLVQNLDAHLVQSELEHLGFVLPLVEKHFANHDSVFENDHWVPGAVKIRQIA